MCRTLSNAQKSKVGSHCQCGDAMSEQKPPLYINTELGLEKRCKECGEYYPATKEFFYGTGRAKVNGEQLLVPQCKDCYKQRFKPWIKGSYDVSHRYEKIGNNT